MGQTRIGTRGRARGVVRRGVRAALIAGATLMLCGIGILFSLNTDFSRTLLADAINRSLAGYFCGQVTVEHIEHVGLSGVTGVRVSVEDPAGNRVLALNELDVRIALVPTLRDLLLNRKALSLTITELSLDQVTLSLQSDATNSLKLQAAFRVCAPPTTSGRSVRLAIRKIRATHLLVHAEVLGVPAFDAQFKDVIASLILIPGKLAIDVDGFSIATRGVAHGADVGGGGRVKFVLPLSNPGELLARVSWAGRLYDTEVSVELQWLAGFLRLAIDAPHVPTPAIRRFSRDFPEGPDTTVHAELRGTPPELAVQSHLARGSGSLEVTGQVRLGDQRRADLHLIADSVDLEQLIAGAPETELNATAELSAQQAASGPVSGEFHAELPPNRIAGISVPPVSIQANFFHAPDTLSNLEAKVFASEAGAPAQLVCQLTSNREGTELTFEGDVRAPVLERVPRLRQKLRGKAIAELQGKLDLSHGTLDAKLALESTGVHRAGLDVGDARLHGTLRGSLKSPRLDLVLDARQLDIAGAKFSEGHFKAHGPLASAKVAAALKAVNGANMNVGGLLRVDDHWSVRDLAATFDRGSGTVKASAKVVDLYEGIRVDHALVEGLGEPLDLSVAWGATTLRVHAVGKGLDISQWARVTQAGSYGGILDLDVDVGLTPGHTHGRVAVNLTHAQVGNVRDWSAQAEANLQGRDFSARLRSDYGNGNWVTVQTADMKIGGRANEVSSWAHWSGQLAVDARVDLAELVRQLPRDLIRLHDLQGKLGLHADVTRGARAGSRPRVTVSAQGTQLAFSLRRPSAKTNAGQTTGPEFRNLEANLGIAYDGDSNRTLVNAGLSDREGDVALLQGSVDALPYGSVPYSLRDGLQELGETRFAAQLDLPRRALKSLPGGFVPARTRGDVASRLTWTGSLMHPDLNLEAKLTQARVGGLGITRPLDLTLIAHYDGQTATANLKAELDDRIVLDTDTQLQVRATDWLAGGDQPAPWEASARARLIAFPLERIRSLGNNEVSGTLNGELRIEGLHRDARASLTLETSQLRVRDLVLTGGSAQVVVRPTSFDARIRLEENPSFAEARMSGASTWGDALLPALDDSLPQRAALSASSFRIATLLPFTGGLFSDFDGRLDAEISAEIDRRARTTGLSGVANLRGGVFELAAGGGEFHDVDAKLVLRPDGTVQLESLTAQGVTGRLQLTASARFDGFGWASTEAHLWIPANSPIPLTLEDAGYGTVFGQLDALAVRASNRRDVLVDIDVPSLNVMLPASSTRTVQQLQPIAGVRLGSRQANGSFVPLPTRRRTSATTSSDSAPSAQMTVSVNLGKEVKVTRGNSLDVNLTGHPQITLSDTVAFSGQIQLVRGFLDIEGKRFDIEQGTVSFVGDDPTNPQADVTASWTAPDGTVVYAEFSGPLRTGKVTLRSDPPLSNNEILALMLFGGSDRLSNTSADQARVSGSNMIGVAQGAATQPINHALHDYGLRGVSARVDTSAANPRPEVEVRIARDIAVQIAWVLGTPPPGSNPDRTLFTIDWQFFRRWSLETTVGDAGTSIADVIWQYSY